MIRVYFLFWFSYPGAGAPGKAPGAGSSFKSRVPGPYWKVILPRSIGRECGRKCPEVDVAAWNDSCDSRGLCCTFYCEHFVEEILSTINVSKYIKRQCGEKNSSSLVLMKKKKTDTRLINMTNFCVFTRMVTVII